MDWEWLKEVIAVAAQHGPWAVLCYALVYFLVREGRLNREAHIGTSVVLTKLTTLIEGLDRKERSDV